jgi:hypothetical protein
MDKQTINLVKVLNEIHTLLIEDQNTPWASTIKNIIKSLEQKKYEGLEELNSIYGGMGSFNDLILCQTEVNRKLIWSPNYKETNKRFDDLRSMAYDLMIEIKRK